MPLLMQYIPEIMISFVVFWCWSILPISFMVTSLALKRWYECPIASEASLKNIGKWISWALIQYKDVILPV